MPNRDFDKSISKHEGPKSAVRERSEQALFWYKCFEKPLSKSPIGIEYYSNAKSSESSGKKAVFFLPVLSNLLNISRKIMTKIDVCEFPNKLN